MKILVACEESQAVTKELNMCVIIITERKRRSMKNVRNYSTAY